MKIYICRECGHTDEAEKAYNGECEPATCVMCDSGNIIITDNDKHKDGAGNSINDLYPFGVPKRAED